MIDRRKFLGMAAGAGATLALTPNLLRALQQPGGKLIQRAIPSTGELLPVIGVARGPVQNNARLAHLVNMAVPSSEAYAMLKAVVKTMIDNGGRVLDSSDDEGQQVIGRIAEELGIKSVALSTRTRADPACRVHRRRGAPANRGRFRDAISRYAFIDSLHARDTRAAMTMNVVLRPRAACRVPLT